MYRMIKFRQWDSFKKRMIDGAEIVSNGHFRAFALSAFDVNPAMQFIEIFDRLGREIYEGDIVKGVGKHKGQSEVFYDSGRWQPFGFLGTFSGDEFEVIGNIHQHKHLLEG